MADQLRRTSPAMLRAAAWALRARFRARRIVRSSAVPDPAGLPMAPDAPLDAERAVRSVLGRTYAKCLVRSLVMQRWYTDHGEPCDVIIGVTSPQDGFRAHAWLDRPGELDGEGFTELHRLTPVVHASGEAAPSL
jgi:hypothetical protein